MRRWVPLRAGARVVRGVRAGIVACVLAALAACASARAPKDALSASNASLDGGDDAGDASGDAALDADADDSGEDDASADDASADDAAASTVSGPCPRNMVLVDVASAEGAPRFCVDRYEGSLVETLADGSERPYPHYLPVDGHVVRAVSEPGVFPQGFISELQADDACQASGKRLCTADEWMLACSGPARTTFPYGPARTAGVCHDAGKSPVAAVFGAAALASPSSPAASASAQRNTSHVTHTKKPATSKSKPARSPTTKKVQSAPKSPKRRSPSRRSGRPADVTPDVWTKLNDPRLGQVEGALSRTGDHEACVSSVGALDMVGNLHEWVATDRSLPHGTFAGGYYLDTHLNGDGCNYRTVAHAHEYHDYSTGFRCCKDVEDVAR